tara:strand:+ start:199 stop:759 length:561 start_codon:yes stop_codon:yes gene_type:complete
MIFENKKQPAIYIRFFNKVIMYIGETQDWKMGRPFRDGDDPKYRDKQLMDKLNKLAPKNKKTSIDTKKYEEIITEDFDPYKYSIGNFDKIRILKAPSNSKRRRYWEAVLITKYQPITQTNTLNQYYTLTKKKYNSEEIKNSLRKKVDLFTKENTKKMKRNYMYQIIDGVNNLKTLNKFIKEEKRNV